MSVDLLKFEQTLHGYDNGHRLLASSLTLDPKDERALLSMSDLSGPRATENFLEYVTGYTLPSGSYYVVAKTWYANEMERPGCVWTHSILMSVDALPKITDLSSIRHMFFRPKLRSGYRYSDPLVAPSDDFQAAAGLHNADLQATVVACGLQTLFSSEDPLVALMASNGQEYEEFCLALWAQLWARVRTAFSFCTGSLSRRVLNGRPLALQFGPDRVVRDMRERVTKECSPADWAVSMLHDLMHPGTLRRFFLDNGGECNRLGDVCRLGEIFLALNGGSFERAFAHLLPNDSQKAPRLVEAVTSEAERRMPPLEYLGLLDDYEERGFSFSKQIVYAAIKRALTTSREGVLNLVARLRQPTTTRIHRAIVISIAKTTDIHELVALADLHPELYLELLNQRPELVYSPEIWSSSLPLLDKLELFEVARKDDRITKQRVFEAVLESRDPDLSSEVVKHLGADDLRITLDWLVGCDSNIILRSQWLAYLRQYQDGVLVWAVDQQPTYSLALILANVVDSVETRVTKLPQTLVLGLAAVAYKQVRQRDEVAAFVYVSTSLISDVKAAEYCTRAFADLHAAIAESRLSSRAWQILERNLMPLPHEQWDACEKLRRAVLHFKVQNRWPVAALWTLMATQTDLFHDFIRTAKGFDLGRLFFGEVRDAGVRRELPVTKQQFKEIKKLLR